MGRQKEGGAGTTDPAAGCPLGQCPAVSTCLRVDPPLCCSNAFSDGVMNLAACAYLPVVKLLGTAQRSNLLWGAVDGSTAWRACNGGALQAGSVTHLCDGSTCVPSNQRVALQQQLQ